MLMQGKKLTTEQRARVIAFLLAGETIARTAARSGVSERTVKNVKASDEFAQLCLLKEESEPSLSELVTQHLATALEASIALARHITMGDEWFSRQNAKQIGLLYGILSDTAVGIYDAKLRSEKLELERRQLEAPNINGR